MLERKPSLPSTRDDHGVCAGPFAGAEMLKAHEGSWVRILNLLSIFNHVDTHRDE